MMKGRKVSSPRVRSPERGWWCRAWTKDRLEGEDLLGEQLDGAGRAFEVMEEVWNGPEEAERIV